MSLNNHIIEIKTVQTNAFKILCEALKEILTDVNIEFNENYMKIIAMDPSQTILVRLKLDSDKFEYFYCEKKFLAGVNMSNLFKLLRTLTNNDALTLFIDKNNTNQLGIRIENGEKNLITTYHLNLIEVDEQGYQIPEIEFESVITMPSNEFTKICKDMINISDVIEIKSIYNHNIGNQLIFSCVGEFAQQETILGESNNGLSFSKQNDTHDIIQGNYNLKHVVLFSKCTNLCGSIEIYIKNDFPIVIKFSVGSLGDVLVCLAPKIEEKHDDNDIID